MHRPFWFGVGLASACSGDGSGWHTWLDCVYLRTVACDYARLRVRGGVGRVVSFASLRVVSSRSLVSLASLLCLHVRGRVIAGLRVFYVFAIFGIFGIFVILGIFACLHVCMFAVVSWVACLRVGIYGIFAHACLQ